MEFNEQPSEDYGHLEKYELEQCRHLREVLNSGEKAVVIGLNYANICELKSSYEAFANKQLREALGKKLVDRYESMPFQLTPFLQSIIDLPYTSASHFSKALNLGTIPYEHCKIIYEALYSEYKEVTN